MSTQPTPASAPSEPEPASASAAPRSPPPPPPPPAATTAAGAAAAAADLGGDVEDVGLDAGDVDVRGRVTARDVAGRGAAATTAATAARAATRAAGASTAEVRQVHAEDRRHRAAASRCSGTEERREQRPQLRPVRRLPVRSECESRSLRTSLAEGRPDCLAPKSFRFRVRQGGRSRGGFLAANPPNAGKAGPFSSSRSNQPRAGRRRARRDRTASRTRRASGPRPRGRATRLGTRGGS